MIAYDMGRQAFIEGRPNSENPFKQIPVDELLPGGTTINPQRQEWFNGWLDAWRLKKWGPNPGEELFPQDKVLLSGNSSLSVYIPTAD